MENKPLVDYSQIRIESIHSARDRGIKPEDLEDQPAFWMLEGLRALGRGETIDKEWLRRVDESGGTDHPDPFV